MIKCFNPCCKSVGLSCFTFCAGMTAGLCLPIGVVAVLEACMILFLGYMCLFRW